MGITVNEFLAQMFWNKKSSYCHHLGVVGVHLVVGFGVTNFNLGHISVIILHNYMKLGMCIHYHKNN